MDLENINIIVVDKNPAISNRLPAIYEKSNICVSREYSIDRVLERFETEFFDILIITISSFKSEIADSIDLIEVITNKSPVTQILFLVESQDIRLAMSALKAGTSQYAKLPIGDEELRLLIETALEKRPVYGTNLLLKEERRQVIFEKLIGQSLPMQQVYQQIRQAAVTDIPVLLTGETGTGKDLAAQAIHQQSTRSKGSYIAVNLGALPSDLVAGELFGHERGAFTGATQQREGKFELAHDGTIFLDEIDTIDEKVQISLLRLIELKKFQRIGGKKDITSHSRIVASSNKDLHDCVEKKLFREDLFYRLDVFRITLPALRDRPGDISLLIDEFLKRYNLEYQKTILGIAPDCVNILESYSWPGNVRELKNVIQRAVLVCDGDVLLTKHLPPRFKSEIKRKPTITFEVGTTLQEIEKETMVRVLSYCENNRKRAAEVLGISRRALYNKLAKHGIS